MQRLSIFHGKSMLIYIGTELKMTQGEKLDLEKTKIIFLMESFYST